MALREAIDALFGSKIPDATPAPQDGPVPTCPELTIATCPLMRVSVVTSSKSGKRATVPAAPAVLGVGALIQSRMPTSGLYTLWASVMEHHAPVHALQIEYLSPTKDLLHVILWKPRTKG